MALARFSAASLATSALCFIFAAIFFLVVVLFTDLVLANKDAFRAACVFANVLPTLVSLAGLGLVTSFSVCLTPRIILAIAIYYD
jgi:hypothetical protein